MIVTLFDGSGMIETGSPHLESAQRVLDCCAAAIATPPESINRVVLAYEGLIADALRSVAPEETITSKRSLRRTSARRFPRYPARCSAASLFFEQRSLTVCSMRAQLGLPTAKRLPPRRSAAA